LLGEIRIDESGMLGFEIGSRVEHHLDGFFAIEAMEIVKPLRTPI
jgi:hypothetical protein